MATADLLNNGTTSLVVTEQNGLDIFEPKNG